MKKWILTFGQNNPFKNGWIEVFAESEIDARHKIIDIFGNKWAFLYPEDKPNLLEYFPDGKLGEIR